MGIGDTSLPGGNLSQGTLGDEAKHQMALIDSLASQLTNSQSLTVSLDAAIFDDGTLVGPDSAGLFDRLQAQIDAQDHLVRDAIRGVGVGKRVDQVLDELTVIGNQPMVAITENSSGAKVKDKKDAQVGRWAWDVFLVPAN